MLKVDIIVVGRLRKGPYYELSEEYKKRIRWNLSVFELEAETQAGEIAKIAARLDNNAFIVVMDERGNGLKSLDFADTLSKLQDGGTDHLQVIVGGHEGLTDEIRDRANLMLSFGQQTWPHMLARIMLLEQIYRAQQIIAGHPYHRE